MSKSKGHFNVGRFAIPYSVSEPVTCVGSVHSLAERHAELNVVRDGTLLEGYGFMLRWSPNHLRPKELESWRHQGDELADEAVRLLAAHKRGELGCVPDKATLELTAIERLETLEHAHPAARAFLHHARAVPDWLDWHRLRRGQHLFSENAAACSLNLLNLSLVGGFGAPKINKVLDATGYLTKNRDITYCRLFETMQMFVDCLPAGSLNAGGGGWMSVLNVRLLHASVRTWLVDTHDWNSGEYGVPINQEDMVVTQLAFSIVILMGMERLGVTWHMSDEYMDDYLHMWRYIGYLVGLTEDHNTHMTCIRRAQDMLESIASHIVHPDATSKSIGLHVIDAISFRAPAPRSHHQMVGLTRALTGDAYADAIGIPALDDPALYHAALARIGSKAALAATADMGVGGASIADQNPFEGIRTKSWGAAAGSVLFWLFGMLLALTAWVYATVRRSFTCRKAVDYNAMSEEAIIHSLHQDATNFAQRTFRSMQLLPYLVRMPLLGGWVVSAIMAGMTATMEARLGGRSKFPIRFLPKSRLITGADPVVGATVDAPSASTVQLATSPPASRRSIDGVTEAGGAGNVELASQACEAIPNMPERDSGVVCCKA